MARSRRLLGSMQYSISACTNSRSKQLSLISRTYSFCWPQQRGQASIRDAMHTAQNYNPYTSTFTTYTRMYKRVGTHTPRHNTHAPNRQFNRIQANSRGHLEKKKKRKHTHTHTYKYTHKQQTRCTAGHDLHPIPPHNPSPFNVHRRQRHAASKIHSPAALTLKCGDFCSCCSATPAGPSLHATCMPPPDAASTPPLASAPELPTQTSSKLPAGACPATSGTTYKGARPCMTKNECAGHADFFYSACVCLYVSVCVYRMMGSGRCKRPGAKIFSKPNFLADQGSTNIAPVVPFERSPKDLSH